MSLRADMPTGRHGRLALIGPPYLWLVLFFLAPFAIVLKISLAETAIGIPPYTPLLGADEAGELQWQVSGASYALLTSDALYWRAYLNSLLFAGIATALCLVIGYPMAYAIARAPRAWKNPLLMLVILPFWTSFLIRVYAWVAILRPTGFLNAALIGLGLISEPLPLINNAFSVILGLVYTYLPFMILPLYATLERLDWSLLEAAEDLGARPWRAFLRVTLPLSLPGILGGVFLVFVPAVGEFIIPDLLGGPDTLMIGKVLWDEFFTNRDWPAASAVAIAMLVLLLLPILAVRRLERRELGA